MEKKNNKISNGVNKYEITTKQAGERLDKFLAEEIKEITRNQLQKLIKSGQFLVNNKEASVHYKLKDGDIVDMLEAKVDNSVLPDLASFVVGENDEYLIINKPAGVIVHGGLGIKEKTLADSLLKLYPEIAQVGEDEVRPGIVHRLDKEASGLMVVAKTSKSYDNLKKQFQNRTILKEYTALVYGVLEKAEDKINFPIKRSSKGHKMAALPDNENIEDAREAITDFKTAKKLINFTLLNVTIKTGRTHQIRAHMAAYGHPIVGDNIYSTKKTREQNKKNDLGRVFLVASRLSFYDLAGNEQTFTVDLPKDLEDFLATCK